MNTLSRTITGLVAILLGLFLIGLGFFTIFVTWFYGIPILIIGLFILFNKNEDKIEGIKQVDLVKKNNTSERRLNKK